MSNDRPGSCPEHAKPNDKMYRAWPCPDDCPHLLAEIDFRIEAVENGNYTRTSKVDGVRYWQKFVNHQPVGEPMPSRRYRSR